MLKGKKALYILIPLNIFVWGFFAYRIVEAFRDTEAPSLESSRPAVTMPALSDSLTYSLKLNYKDPFLKDVEKPRNYNPGHSDSKQIVKTPTVPVVKTPTLVPKQLPEIKYLGLVKNNSSGTMTALISINGQSRIARINDVIEGITFKNFTRDSLVARMGKEKIVVRR